MFLVKDFLIKNGFFEVVNNPFVNVEENHAIKVDNPLDSNRQFIRTNLERSLIENLLYNERRQQDSIKLFEISDVYSIDSNIKNKKVISVKINNTELKNFDNIVYNGDPITLYKKILKGNISFKNRFLTSNVKISMGLYVLFFGTKFKYKDVPHHSIIFCK